MTVDHVTIIGSIAAVCTTVSFIPQVVKVYKTRETRDLSLLMYVIFSVGVFFWFCYGLLTRSLPIIIANFITLILSLYIVAMKIRRG